MLTIVATDRAQLTTIFYCAIRLATYDPSKVSEAPEDVDSLQTVHAEPLSNSRLIHTIPEVLGILYGRLFLQL